MKSILDDFPIDPLAYLKAAQVFGQEMIMLREMNKKLLEIIHGQAAMAPAPIIIEGGVEIERLKAEVERLEAEDRRLRDAWACENEEICQFLGQALDYPRYSDDQASFPGSTGPDVCTGEHVAVTIAIEAADRIKALDAEVKRTIRIERDRGNVERIASGVKIERLKAEVERLTARDKEIVVGCARENEEICQRLGQALDYPRFSDDQKNFPGATGPAVCVGEHVAVTIAAEAADHIKALRDLVQHCWVHSGHRDCGHQQMTTEQKRLYRHVIGRTDPDPWFRAIEDIPCGCSVVGSGWVDHHPGRTVTDVRMIRGGEDRPVGVVARDMKAGDEFPESLLACASWPPHGAYMNQEVRWNAEIQGDRPAEEDQR